MRHTILVLSAGFFVFSAQPPAPAQAQQQDSADLARSVFQQNIKTTSVGATKETPGAGGTPPPGAVSINPSAAKGKSSQSSGSDVNSAAGAALMAAGAALMANPPTQPAGAALMAMGLLAMMQAGHDAGAAGESAATYNASQFGNPHAATPLTDPAAGTSGFSGAIKDANAKLADAGYELSAKGLKNPDGSMTPASAFASSGAMSAAGLDPNAVKEAKKVTDALNDEISKLKGSGTALASGGGGGFGGGENQNATEEDKHQMGSYSNPFALNAADKRNLIAGKTVNFDGEPIGVRGQNIFEMIHVAYQKRRDGRAFIESETTGTLSVRAPANVSLFPAHEAKSK